MKLTIIYLYVLLTIGCATIKNSSNDYQKLNGDWKPIKQEMSGNELPNSVFVNQKLKINDSTYVLIAESTDKGIIRITDNKMDIFGKDGVNKGKHFTAIYKIENDQLTICYNLIGDIYPESFDTKGKSLYFLSIFKRE